MMVCAVSVETIFAMAASRVVRACLTSRSQAARYVGIGLASLVKAFDPGVVVLGGGVALNAPEGYWEALLEAYRRYLQGWEAPPLRRARLGAEAGLLGAALTAYLEVKDGSG